MIVHDEESTEQALQMLEVSPEGVRYSDEYSYIIITIPGTLELQCQNALLRNGIAIVVPRGRESEMEDYAQALTRVRERRVREEKRKIKAWLREHPEQVAKIEKKLK